MGHWPKPPIPYPKTLSLVILPPSVAKVFEAGRDWYPRFQLPLSLLGLRVFSLFHTQDRLGQTYRMLPFIIYYKPRSSAILQIQKLRLRGAGKPGSQALLPSYPRALIFSRGKLCPQEGRPSLLPRGGAPLPSPQGRGSGVRSMRMGGKT